MADTSVTKIDFDNTEIAFSYKSDKELKRTHQLFSIMNSGWLVELGSLLTPLVLKLRLPLVKPLIKATIFKQFVGGENLLDTQKVISLLRRYNTLTILDYGAEAKSEESELDAVVEEFISAIEMAASNESVPIISTKITGLADNDLLIKMQSDKELTVAEQSDKEKLLVRLDKICKRAYELGVGVMIDAEESWMQITIDALVDEMMEKYNKDKVIVYNTFQLYRKDKYDFLVQSHQRAQERNYLLGAKLVRGAYMDKERSEAGHYGLPVVINETKTLTDREYNKALEYCTDNYLDISVVCASHNAESTRLFAQMIIDSGIAKNHPHLNFSQLYGMSDNLTFNLAKAGFNVAKYVPYGPLTDVVPYLIRRAQENKAVASDMSRELSYISKEIKRRRSLNA